MTQERTQRTDLPMQDLPLDFTAFHRMQRPRYIRAALQIFRTRHEAEDAVDDVFEHLLNRWDKVLRSDNAEAYAWVVMRNRLIDYRTAASRRTALEEAAFATQALLEAEDPIAQVEESLALFHAITQLGDRQQEVVVMRVLADMPEAEVAQTLGTSAASVRSNLRHARRRLAEMLAPLDQKEDDRDHTDR